MLDSNTSGIPKENKRIFNILSHNLISIINIYGLKQGLNLKIIIKKNVQDNFD